MAPSPSVFLSAIAQRTRRLRFGTFVYALPIHHPLRVLEEICMLDHMSGGRWRSVSAAARCLTRFPTTARMPRSGSRFTPSGSNDPQGFHRKTLNWNGKYDQFENVPMEIEPFRSRIRRCGTARIRPTAPSAPRARACTWSATTSAGLARAIHRALPPGLARGERRERGAAENGHGADDRGGRQRREALTIARRAYLRWRTSFCYLHEMHGTPPNSPLNVESFDKLVEQGQAIAGSPETVRTYLAKADRGHRPQLPGRAALLRRSHARRDAAFGRAVRRACDARVAGIKMASSRRNIRRDRAGLRHRRTCPPRWRHRSTGFARS